jgi:hypothetical protein
VSMHVKWIKLGAPIPEASKGIAAPLQNFQRLVGALGRAVSEVSDACTTLKYSIFAVTSGVFAIAANLTAPARHAD